MCIQPPFNSKACEDEDMYNNHKSQTMSVSGQMARANIKNNLPLRNMNAAPMAVSPSGWNST